MAALTLGSRGPAVVALQRQLISLGVLAGEADGVLGSETALALRDAQRRLRLRPDGVVGPLTAAALAAATGAPANGNANSNGNDNANASTVPAQALQPVEPVSPYRALVREARALAARGEASEERLPILDRGLAASAFRNEPGTYAARLAARPRSSELTPYPDRFGSFRAYPAHGVVPAILSGRDGRGGLEFLSEEVSQACLCIGRFSAGQPLRVRWYGRRALEDNVQFWSATKFIAGMHVVCQANRRCPGIPIDDSWLQCRDGSPPERFSALLRAMVDYGPRPGESDGGGSNRIGYLLKQLLNPGEDDVQTWLRRLGGNQRALLLGWYGQWRTPAHPFQAGADLVGPGWGDAISPHGGPGQPRVLVEHRLLPRTRNLLSAYDLVRMITLLGWHPQLDQDQRLPGAQWSSLASLVDSLGHDTARYLDVALEQLGLLEAISEPVILSKLGYGAVTGDPGIDALTYTAFASCRDNRSQPARQRCFALALRIPTRAGLEPALRHDARMAAEVTELVRRIFAEELH